MNFKRAVKIYFVQLNLKHFHKFNKNNNNNKMKLILVAILVVMFSMTVNSSRIIVPKEFGEAAQRKMDRITSLMEKEAEQAKNQPKEDDKEFRLLDLSKYPNALNYVKLRFGDNQEVINKVFRERIPKE